MLLLTDAPDAAARLLPDGGAFAPLDSGATAGRGAPSDVAGSVGVAPEAFWRRFGGDPAAVVRADLPDAAFGLAGPLLVVGAAPDSQFDRMNADLRAGRAVPDGLVAVALAGSRFRGQRGRAWTALAGNLHLSAHLALDVDAADAQAALAVLPAVATARAIETVSEGRVRPGLKWVNDLVLDGAKLGGVLSQTHVAARRARHVVVGIGLNVARAPDLAPSPRTLPAGRLADADPSFAGEGAWARLLPTLARELARGRDRLAAGGASLVDAYRDRAAFLGRRVTIWPVDGPDDAAPLARGRVLELLPDLALVLEGVPEPVRTGRMTLES